MNPNLKDFFLLYVLLNFFAYGGAVGTIYKQLHDGTFKCDTEISSAWAYSLIAVAGFMLENSHGLILEVNDYCEIQTTLPTQP